MPGTRDEVQAGPAAHLVPPGGPVALGEGLHELALERERRAELTVAARERAERFAWPHVTREVLRAYDDAIELAAAVEPSPARRLGLRSADGLPVQRPRRLRAIEPAG